MYSWPYRKVERSISLSLKLRDKIPSSKCYIFPQDSRARNEDLEERVTSSVKKQEVVMKSLESQVKLLESAQKNMKSSSQGTEVTQKKLTFSGRIL